jgi:uncharacterized protein (TIGR03437 family)
LSTGTVASNSASFAITDASAPSIISLNPGAVQAGGPSFNLSVNGSGFANSQILWDGAVIPTIYISPNQLTAFVPSNLIATPRTSNITVTTAVDGGVAASNALPFTITGAGPRTQ